MVALGGDITEIVYVPGARSRLVDPKLSAAASLALSRRCIRCRLEFSQVSRLRARFVLRGAFDQPIEFGAEKGAESRQPEPEKQDHDRAQRAIHAVVGPKG